jgi:hypothetical protein
MPRSLGTPRCYFFFLAGAFLAAFFAAFLVAFFIDLFSVTSNYAIRKDRIVILL